jgi:uncharacterized protein (DUF2267 family)
MEEKATIEAAPLGQAADTANKGVEQTPVNASTNVEAPKVSTDNVQPASVGSDPRTSYESLVKELGTINKSYGDLRKEFTRRTQYESELKKQIDTLSKAFAEATKEEISPEDFIKAIQTQGVKAFHPLKDQWTKEIREEYDKSLTEEKNARMSLQTNFEIMRREMDSSNYPDFAQLKDAMNDIANSDNCPVDWSQDTGVVLDTLYKLARSYSMENAIREAKSIGSKEAEAKIAKESATAVAPGGKSGGPTNPTDIKDLSKLRQYFVSQIGEAE